jgi:glutamine amidotransferase
MPVSIAIVDYGVGNQASVVHTLRSLGYRVRLSATPQGLDDAQLLVLPGVGAFPAAMRVLEERGLVSYLQEQARSGRPILGICLGMQLLAEASHEHGYTQGLSLLPGDFVPFANGGWHIGWNTIDCDAAASWLKACHGQAFYFNHSYYYRGPDHVQVARAGAPHHCAAIIRHEKVVGVQFHPEKSQQSGRVLLEELITGLTHA